MRIWPINLLLCCAVSIPACAASARTTTAEEDNLASLEQRAAQAPAKSQCYEYAQLVHEMVEYSARQFAAGDVEKAAEMLSETVGTVVVKRGSQGVLARRSHEEFVGLPPKVEVADHVGAGDSFDAGFIHQFIRGGSMQDCLAFGNIVGALSVTRPGGTEAFRDAEYRDSFLRAHLAELTSGPRT